MSSLNEVLKDWYQRVSETQRAHYLSADHFGKKKYWLGIPAIALATLVGTSVFATLQKQPDIRLQILVGLASVLAAVLASLQTLLGYAERAEKHRIAGAKYGALGRELEILRASAEPICQERLQELKKRLDDLALESPSNSLRLYKKAAGQLTLRRQSG